MRKGWNEEEEAGILNESEKEQKRVKYRVDK